MARIVHYQFRGPFSFDVDARLRRAEEDGVITEWDDGRGDIPWFGGRPGPRLRALRDEFIQGGGTSVSFPNSKSQ